MRRGRESVGRRTRLRRYSLNRRGIELGRGRYTPTRGLERKEGRVENNYIETEAGGGRIKKEKNKKTAKRDEVRAFHDGTMRGGQ